MLRSWREVAAGYDEAAAGYDDRHAGGQSRARVLDAPLLEATRGARCVLEIGVGTGRLLAQVRAPTAIGVDISRGMLVHARARGLAVVRADAHHLPFRDATFDAVLAGKGVFRYLVQDTAFAEAARVLRPGGLLALQQYGARTWSPRRSPRSRVPAEGVHEVERVDDLLADAGRHGFVAHEVRRYRPIRWAPHFVQIPRWIDRWSPVQLWEHLTVVLRRA